MDANFVQIAYQESVEVCGGFAGSGMLILVAAVKKVLITPQEKPAFGSTKKWYNIFDKIYTTISKQFFYCNC
jgi:hypothetical protein